MSKRIFTSSKPTGITIEAVKVRQHNGGLGFESRDDVMIDWLIEEHDRLTAVLNQIAALDPRAATNASLAVQIAKGAVGK